jgi:alpha-tubulin suppressor-like RCC1 family protein
VPSRSLIGIGVTVLLTLVVAPAAAEPTTPGQIFAFGDNDYGQLGSALYDESEIGNPAPALVAFPAESAQVTQVAAGAEFSLALTSAGELYAFGNNEFGQLGGGTNAGSPEQESNPVPALVTLPDAGGPVTQIAAGELHALALTSTGQLYAFGSNEYGQLGTEVNSGTTMPNPTPAPVTLPGASGPVVQIAAGAAHSLALTATGQLYAFGENDLGQLGNEVNNKSPEPNPKPTIVALPPGDKVTQIAAGSEFSLVLTSTGQLYGFGMNSGGQLGNATNAGIAEPNPTPTLVAFPAGAGAVAQIAGGKEHSLALTSSGQLYAFGSNKYGQLGTDVNSGTEKPNPTPAPVTLPGAIGAITQIAAGKQHSLAVSSSGQLFAFGRNQYGELGSEVNYARNSTNPNPTPTPVALPAGTSVETVARGPDALHTLALATIPAATPTPTPDRTGPPPVVGEGGVLSSTTSAQPPTLTSARLTNSRFRVAGKATAIYARAAPRKGSLGTSFRFTLSARATLRIEFDWTAPGLRRGHACLVPSAVLKRTHAGRCARVLVAGALVRANEPAGPDSVSFSGRIGSSALTPHVYDAVLTASNAAGQSRSVKLPFVVVH